MSKLFLLCFGAYGKIGINCFMLITGYFMCERSITLKKFLKLYLVYAFYSVVLNCAFWLSGYARPHWRDVLYTFFPVNGITTHFFFGAFFVFFLTIPFLNVLVNNMTKRQHQALLALLLPVYTILPFFPGIAFDYNHVSWFGILYFISSYVRKYPNRLTENRRLCIVSAVVAFAGSLASVILMCLLHRNTIYFFVADSNVFTALAASLCFFLAFKPSQNTHASFSGTRLGPFAKFINIVASTTFGVLVIHANSNAMRRWLWHDVCHVKDFYVAHAAGSPWPVVTHAVGCVLAIFAACAIIDLVRQSLFEEPLFRCLDHTLRRRVERPSASCRKGEYV